MFRNQKLNNHINRTHERALRIVYQDHNSRFDERLAKDGSFRIHDCNLQKLLIEIFIPSEFMTVIYRNYLLKYLKLK